jgi:hypothetical protein
VLSKAVGRHDLQDTTRAMAKRGSEDLKKLSVLQTNLVRAQCAKQGSR